MDWIIINQFLLVTMWFALAGLIFLLALIARFYEGQTKVPTYYRYYIIPVITYGIGTARYASISQWGGDLVGDALMSISGMFLLFQCYFLYRQMTTSNSK